MSGFIEEFYYGNIEPQACNTELNKELKKMLSALAEKEELLTAKLNALVENEKVLDSTLKGEEKDLFLKYINAHNEFLAVSITDSFISGFRLGARFAYDTFVDG